MVACITTQDSPAERVKNARLAREDESMTPIACGANVERCWTALANRKAEHAKQRKNRGEQQDSANGKNCCANGCRHSDDVPKA